MAAKIAQTVEYLRLWAVDLLLSSWESILRLSRFHAALVSKVILYVG